MRMHGTTSSLSISVLASGLELCFFRRHRTLAPTSSLWRRDRRAREHHTRAPPDVHVTLLHQRPRPAKISSSSPGSYRKAGKATSKRRAQVDELSAEHHACAPYAHMALLHERPRQATIPRPSSGSYSKAGKTAGNWRAQVDVLSAPFCWSAVVISCEPTSQPTSQNTRGCAV